MSDLGRAFHAGGNGAYDPSTQKAQAGRSGIQDQPQSKSLAKVMGPQLAFPCGYIGVVLFPNARLHTLSDLRV